MYLIKDKQFKIQLERIAGKGAYDPANGVMERLSNDHSTDIFYPLYIREPFCIKNKNFIEAIDKKYLKDIKNNKIKLLIVMVTECFDLFETYRWKENRRKKDIQSIPYYNIISVLLDNNIDLNNVIWLTALSDTKDDIEFLRKKGIDIKCRFVHFNFFIEQQKMIPRDFLPLDNIDKHFSSLAKGTAKHHRFGLMYNLFVENLLPYGKVSCLPYNNFVYSGEVTTNETLPNIDTNEYMKKFKNFDVEKLNNFKKSLPYEVDHLDNGYYPETGHDSKIFKDVFVDIVNETHFTNSKVFITEKTIKAMHYCRPFIINGDRHSLRYLKSMGFKTFDRWWNEDYDECITDWERIEKIIEIVKKLCKIDKKTLSKIYKEMLPIMEHNFNTLKNFKNENIHS